MMRINMLIHARSLPGDKIPLFAPRATPIFESQYNCLVEQYSDYYIPQVDDDVNGKVTLGENIADNGAIFPTFTAYGEFLVIPSIEFLILN